MKNDFNSQDTDITAGALSFADGAIAKTCPTCGRFATIKNGKCQECGNPV